MYLSEDLIVIWYIISCYETTFNKSCLIDNAGSTKSHMFLHINIFKYLKSKIDCVFFKIKSQGK